MPVAKLLVYSNPVAGKEAEYARWYDEQHIPDLLRVPGVIGAQRFTLAEGDWGFVTVYDLDTADADAVMGAIGARVDTPEMPMTDAIDVTNVKMEFCVAASPRQPA